MESTQQSHHLMKRVIDSRTPHQECVTRGGGGASPKPNQVSTVLLYGIPIVSLYIESQERLCLAQISNTLLKQYSYNEIHNRRVALGITCVQCTPVQLEILRRAGAMPVSSRRCGMITRREAERLCKSFLGDNSPPRLPDDFAFRVHHECAWGCRGSFLPARYNSSRAKCIKCAYCGLFFSPNKFIFHSHRIGPGDKYIQPDAANFNSWRRHMKLSGNPAEEIVHAWEDVKAMFNGGTRKRLLHSASSSSGGRDVGESVLRTANISRASQNGRMTGSSGDMAASSSAAKRIKESAPSAANSPHLNPPLIHAVVTAAAAATATAAVAAVNQQFPIRTSNVNGPSTASLTAAANATTPAAAESPLVATQQPAANATAGRIPAALCSDLQLPFTRSFMMDYMWHAQNKVSNFQFSSYTLPWIKQPGLLFLNQQQQQRQPSHLQPQHLTSAAAVATTTPNVTLGSPADDNYIRNGNSGQATVTPSKSLPFYSNSAFRPVVHHNQQQQQQQQQQPSLSSCQSGTSTTSIMSSNTYLCPDDDQLTSSSRNSRDDMTSAITAITSTTATTATIKESISSDDDDELVDIETTEDDDIQMLQLQQQQQQHQHDVSSPPATATSVNFHYRHIDELIAVKMPTLSPPIVEIVETSTEVNCWDDTNVNLSKKLVTTATSPNDSASGLTSRRASSTPPPAPPSQQSSSSTSSSPVSYVAHRSSGDFGNSIAPSAVTLSTRHHHQYHPHNPHQSILGIPPVIIKPISDAATAAAAAAAAVAIAALSNQQQQQQQHRSTVATPSAILPSSTLSKLPIRSPTLSPNSSSSPDHSFIAHDCDKAIDLNTFNNNNNNNNNINYKDSILNSNKMASAAAIGTSALGNVTCGNTVSTYNTISAVATSAAAAATATIPPDSGTISNDQLWSVARLSFDRSEYNGLPSFYRHDISKHFHAFRYQNETTTAQTTQQANGGIS